MLAILRFCASLIAPLTLGWLLAGTCWRSAPRLLRAGLGLGMGLGITGAVYAGILSISDSATISLAGTEGAVLTAATLLFATRRRLGAAPQSAMSPPRQEGWGRAAFIAAIVLGGAAMLTYADKSPQGD